MGSPFDCPPLETSPTPQPTPAEPTKLRLVEEAKDLWNAAQSLESQAKLARKNKDWVWLRKIEGMALKVLDYLWEFIKKAVVLAVFKFIAELCAMILNSVMDALMKKGGQRMDITTNGVAWTGGPVQPAAAAASTTSPSYSDPFSRHYGDQRPIW
jgi:hypothetical protein